MILGIKVRRFRSDNGTVKEHARSGMMDEGKKKRLIGTRKSREKLTGHNISLRQDINPLSC
ncbi:hypothetical protein DRQ16_03860 [bacterium]|nr:MAG: hypothetical protein DRQ16_03860 [bacterium]